MSARGIGALLCGLGGGLIFGALAAHAEATNAAEIRAKNRYDEQLELHKRILERQRIGQIESIVEGPAGLEAELIFDKTVEQINLSGDDLPLPDSSDTIKVGGEITVETQMPPDYVGTASQYADPGTFIQDGKVLSLEYIEEEDYEEEDGRAKEQITIFMGDEPIFVMDGESIENWAELIGDHILVDFYQKIPPGEKDRVLYVRNHRRDEDYEVWQSMP